MWSSGRVTLPQVEILSMLIFAVVGVVVLSFVMRSSSKGYEKQRLCLFI